MFFPEFWVLWMSWSIVADVYVLSHFPNKNRHLGQQRISVFTKMKRANKLTEFVICLSILVFNLCTFYLQIHPIKSLNGYPRLNKLALNTNIFIIYITAHGEWQDANLVLALLTHAVRDYTWTKPTLPRLPVKSLSKAFFIDPWVIFSENQEWSREH